MFQLQCENTFETEGNLMTHERTHNEEKSFACKSCDSNAYIDINIS